VVHAARNRLSDIRNLLIETRHLPMNKIAVNKGELVYVIECSNRMVLYAV